MRVKAGLARRLHDPDDVELVAADGAGVEAVAEGFSGRTLTARPADAQALPTATRWRSWRRTTRRHFQELPDETTPWSGS